MEFTKQEQDILDILLVDIQNAPDIERRSMAVQTYKQYKCLLITEKKDAEYRKEKELKTQQS